MSTAMRDGARARWLPIAGWCVLVVIGTGVGGIVGGLAAVAAIGLDRWRGPRAVAAGAFTMLALAALLTVVEAPASGRAAEYLFDFALDRPLASNAGLAAGILALIAIVLAARAERAPAASAAGAGDRPISPQNPAAPEEPTAPAE